MKNLSTYNNFSVNEEWSKNDPIPELAREEKLGIILIGAPGVGKSTFVNNFIIPRKMNIKSFSTDDVSFMFTKDPNKYYGGASDLNILRLKKYIQSSGQSFIYDTTGSQDKPVFDVFRLARKNGYSVIFIHLVAPLETSLKQNLQRDRNVDDEYIKFVYDRQYHNLEDFANLLRPDNYYIVTNFEGKYKFHKYEYGRMLKRKVDKYVPMVKESHDNKDDVDDIIDTMLDFIDEGENITFYSPHGEMKYTDYLSKNSKYDSFKPVFKGGNKIVSKFDIIYRPKDQTYNGLIELMTNMQSTIGRLGDNGWALGEFNVKSEQTGFTYGKPVKIVYAQYTFTKADITIEEEEFTIDEDELRDYIESLGIAVRDIDVGEDLVTVDFGSYAYDGELNSEAWYDKKFMDVADIFGFAGYDLNYQRARVDFEY